MNPQSIERAASRVATPARAPHFDYPREARTPRRHRVLFFVEGFSDVRFISGLSRICELTVIVPARQYRESGLDRRVADLRLPIVVREIEGGRLSFQLRSFAELWRCARDFDVILAQEFLRGAFNANLAGALRRVPVIDYLNIAPVEYFRCRRERGQIGPLKAALGESTIRTLMFVNGKLTTRCVALGSYLRDVAARHCQRAQVGL